MEGEIIFVRWQLDYDGGGTAFVLTDHKRQVEEHRFDFGSLEDLPAKLADAIRKDGRRQGQIVSPRPPPDH